MAQSESTPKCSMFVQGTREWPQARVGSLGASRVHEAIARTRNGWATSRAGRESTKCASPTLGAFAEAII